MIPTPPFHGGQGRSSDDVQRDGEGTLALAMIFLLGLGILAGLSLAGVIE